MDRQQQEVIASFIQEGDHFRVTTEKVVDLLPGAPMPRVIKRSSYSIIVRGALAAEAAKYGATVECPRWAFKSQEWDGHVEHARNRELYVMSMLDKKSSMLGSSEFFTEESVIGIGTGTRTGTGVEEDATVDVVRQKLDQATVAVVKRYIPPFTGGGAAFPLPLRSIVEIDAPEAEPQPVADVIPEGTPGWLK